MARKRFISSKKQRVRVGEKITRATANYVKKRGVGAVLMPLPFTGGELAKMASAIQRGDKETARKMAWWRSKTAPGRQKRNQIEPRSTIARQSLENRPIVSDVGGYVGELANNNLSWFDKIKAEKWFYPVLAIAGIFAFTRFKK